MRKDQHQSVVISDVDIPFKRVLEIMFTWTFAWLVVSTVLGIGAVIVLVIVFAVIGSAS